MCLELSGTAPRTAHRFQWLRCQATETRTTAPAVLRCFRRQRQSQTAHTHSAVGRWTAPARGRHGTRPTDDGTRPCPAPASDRGTYTRTHTRTHMGTEVRYGMARPSCGAVMTRPQRPHRIPEPCPDNPLVLVLFKRRVRVGSHHLRPLVRVVAGRVCGVCMSRGRGWGSRGELHGRCIAYGSAAVRLTTTRKDVQERAQEPVFCKRLHDGVAGATAHTCTRTTRETTMHRPHLQLWLSTGTHLLATCAWMANGSTCAPAAAAVVCSSMSSRAK